MERKILQNINTEEAIELTRELIRIASPNPPGDNRHIAEFLVKTLMKKGFHSTLSQKEETQVNVVARVKGKGGGRSLLLNGHMDTVPIGDQNKWTVDPLGGECRNGRIYGRGSTDCKSGIAAMIIAAEAIWKADIELRGDIILALVAGEESLSENGTGYLLNEGLISADSVIVTEPTTLPSEYLSDQPLQIFTASRGMVWLEITVEGKAVHAKIAPQGVNAIEKMSTIVLALQHMSSNLHHPLCGSPTINVGIIHGGTSPNIVPDHCQIILDRDMVPGEDPMKVTEQIQRVLHKLQEEDNSLKATMKIISIEDPVEISQDEQIVRVLNEGIKALFSVEAKIGGMIGANDSRFFIKRGIPTVICGPGITTQSHQIDEYVETRSVFNAAKAYALTMIRFCQ